ncbi:MAG: preprotein translocase subunit YajC [Epsilonproteobacteria bacterium]|nr:MAG: preprotein translocase subunit YajC [Campylobacterota bacterium]
MDTQGGNLLGSLLPLVALFAIFYFLIIRPQQRQAKEHKQMVAALKVGDEVVTNGGVIVVINKITDSFYEVKNMDGSKMKVAIDYIASKIEK